MSASSVFSWLGLGLNAVAAVVLISALFPPFLDTKRSKKTFGVSASFFTNYVLGNLFMILNSISTVVAIATNYSSAALPALILFGGVFLAINSLSIYMNSYILKTKKANVRAAEERGMTEQEYYEKYLANQE